MPIGTAQVSSDEALPLGDESVAVVITTFNDAAYLSEAIASVVAQCRPADEILVVDDGSDESPAGILAAFPQVRLLHKRNGGLSSARNFGLHHAQSRYITFLDADDRFEPNAIEAGLACFSRNPGAGMVYGGHRLITGDGIPFGEANFDAGGHDAYANLLEGNIIGMHAAVMYRRKVLISLGGFDESLPKCEDYDLYLRLAQRWPVASHPQIIALYRRHGQNMSTDMDGMLRVVLAVHERHRKQSPERRRAWYTGQRVWRDWYQGGQIEAWGHERDPSGWSVIRRALSVLRREKRQRRHGRLHRLIARFRGSWPPPLGGIDFGNVAGTTPVSLDFGWDRGTPIDRYYIENFLGRHAADIKGRVLEIGDDSYSRRFGGDNISRQDILHVSADHPKVTILGDLTQPDVLPEGVFDCIVLTQTLQLIFDLEQAVKRLHAALKPGGIVLLTVPGISQIDRGEWGEAWCWSFTKGSIRRLFQSCFPAENLDISADGNVFSAIAYLLGAALEEVDRGKLDVQDSAYPVVITLRAQKA